MDDKLVIEIVKNLKSSSSSTVETALSKIRSKIITSDEGMRAFKENNGLECLLPLIRKPNEKILDITLSILGNCCLNEECIVPIEKLHIYGYIATILQTVAKDSILGRACRIVGNLSRKRSNAYKFHSYGVVKALVEIIEKRDKSTSNPTLIMAVRALSKLWIEIDKREEMLTHDCIGCVARLMSANCEEAGLFDKTTSSKEGGTFLKSQGELMETILKCLVTFTARPVPQCADKQINGDCKGYKSLVELINHYETFSLQIVFNLCYIHGSRLELGKVGFVESLVNVLQKKTVSQWPCSAPRALAQLSKESVNRSRLLHSGGLTLLVAATKISHCAFQALLEYVFDDKALQILINEGLIDILTEQLKEYLSTMRFQHGKAKLRKQKKTDDVSLVNRIDSDSDEESSKCKNLKRSRKQPCYPEEHADLIPWPSGDSSPIYPATMKCSDGEQSGFSPEYPGFGSKRKYSCPDWSPESGCFSGDGAPLSPSSTMSPSSPFSIDCDSSDSDISGRYSPVCNDNEVDIVTKDEDDNTSIINTNDELITEEFDDLIMKDDSCLDDEVSLKDRKAKKSSGSSQVACILILMHRVTNGIYKPTSGGDPMNAMPLDGIISRECVSALLDYLNKCDKPMGRISKILTQILSHPLSIIRMIKFKIPLKIHKMMVNPKHPIKKCVQCEQITDLCTKFIKLLREQAESGYGLGEISYIFLHPSSRFKCTFALTIPYIVENIAMLKKYYQDCNALPILFSSLTECKEIVDIAIVAIVKLAQSIKIKNPKPQETYFKDFNIIVPDFIQNKEGDSVTFEMDDSSVVTVNRSLLCENSEVFNAMLLGKFMESTQVTVRLPHVNQHSFQYLLTLLFLGYNEPEFKSELFPFAEDIETVLETLLLADRYLLHKIKIDLHNALIQFRLNTDTVLRIYSWSLADGASYLRLESIQYLLTATIVEAKRIELFREFLKREFKEECIDDIKSVICQCFNNCAERV